MGHDGVRFKGWFQNVSELLFQAKLSHNVASGLNISRAATPQTSPSMTYLQWVSWKQNCLAQSTVATSNHLYISGQGR